MSLNCITIENQCHSPQSAIRTSESNTLSLHHLYVTPQPCRVHRQLLRRRSERWDRQFRSLLQFGLTPKSKRGLASSEAVDALW